MEGWTWTTLGDAARVICQDAGALHRREKAGRGNARQAPPPEVPRSQGRNDRGVHGAPSGKGRARICEA